MKALPFLLIFNLLICSCSTQPTRDAKTNEQTLTPEKNEEGEWDLEVLDSNYTYFLNAVAKPITMYSESFLKNRNQLLVSEWNSYYYSGTYRNIIESSISYDPNENYGKKFDYKLYQVFVFVQWKYGLKLNGISKAEWQ